MKNERQEKILAIIAASAIETQEQLIDSLRKEGISCTQATISRDIKQLHLIKEPTGNGTYRYAVSTQKMRLNLADRLQTILRESIVSVDCAQNLVLIKTMAGLGPAAGAAFDGMDISAKVGTVAGDDTVLIVMRENESAAELCDMSPRHLGNICTLKISPSSSGRTFCSAAGSTRSPARPARVNPS